MEQELIFDEFRLERMSIEEAVAEIRQMPEMVRDFAATEIENIDESGLAETVEAAIYDDDISNAELERLINQLKATLTLAAVIIRRCGEDSNA